MLGLGRGLDQFVECGSELLLGSSGITVPVKHHADITIGNSQFFCQLLKRNFVGVHQTHQISCPFFRQLFSTPLDIFS